MLQAPAELQRRESEQPALMEDAFSKIVAGLAVDMPLLMHGSGDVPPDHGQNSAAVNLLSSLTAQYIAHLTDAALDSHSMLCDGANSRRTGDSSMKVQRLPPPAFPVSRNPPIPSPPSPLLTQQQSKGQSAVITARGRKRHRARDDFWDLPLPEPKIKKQNDSAIKEKQDDSAGRKNISFGGDEVEIEENVTTPHVHVDEWVGVTGVDFYQGTSRARLAYVRGPTSGALSTQSFVFPICHDVSLNFTNFLEVKFHFFGVLRTTII